MFLSLRARPASAGKITRLSGIAGIVATVAAALPAFLWVGATCAAAHDRAAGNWNGARDRLADAGIELHADYTAELFVLDAVEDASYLGNLDVTLTLDTERLGAWSGGLLFLYGQNNHGSGLSQRPGLLMPVSNLEAEPFTQLSEFWLEQQLGRSVRVRLGKQDANRDFASPRFAGNFLNSSYGVLPGAPLPSFPAPGLGAAVLADPTPWLGVRAGLYEGEPEIGSLGETAANDGAGLFAIGALLVHHEIHGRKAGEYSVGGWTHTGRDRSGLFGVYDLRIFVNPANPHDERSIQLFVRGGWSPEQAGEIGVYAGGGITAHGFLGIHNTIGLGAGHVRTESSDETFVELFFKWRPMPWFTVGPDVQVHDTETGNPVFVGLRIKLKL